MAGGNFDVVPFCGSPIAKIKSSYVLNNRELDYFYSYSLDKDNESVKMTTKAEVLENTIVENFKDYLLKMGERYRNEVLGIKDNVYITHSWLTKNSKGSWHRRHTHPNIFFSMVYYIKCNSGDLLFNVHKSVLQKVFNFDYDVVNYNPYNSTEWHMPVSTDDIVCFPGDLIHSTTPNLDDEDRMSLGVNFFIKGEIGKDDNYARINI